VAATGLTWKATGEHPALHALDTLRLQYAAGDKTFPVDVTAAHLLSLRGANLVPGRTG
jgi:hypothetical protein